MLQALTIAHELLYDDRVLQIFAQQDTEPLKGTGSVEIRSIGIMEFSLVSLVFVGFLTIPYVGECSSFHCFCLKHRDLLAFPSLRRAQNCKGEDKLSRISL